MYGEKTYKWMDLMNVDEAQTNLTMGFLRTDEVCAAYIQRGEDKHAIYWGNHFNLYPSIYSMGINDPAIQ